MVDPNSPLTPQGVHDKTSKRHHILTKLKNSKLKISKQWGEVCGRFSESIFLDLFFFNLFRHTPLPAPRPRLTGSGERIVVGGVPNFVASCNLTRRRKQRYYTSYCSVCLKRFQSVGPSIDCLNYLLYGLIGWLIDRLLDGLIR